jgi:hypothetical protein
MALMLITGLRPREEVDLAVVVLAVFFAAAFGALAPVTAWKSIKLKIA